MTLNDNKSGGRVVVTTDGGAGSSGKGSLNAWLADKYEFHLATNNWMPNAGHYVEFDDGRRILNQHICSAFVNPNTQLYINAGAAIDLNILQNEMKSLEDAGYDIKSRLTIHPHVNVIVEADKERERKIIKTGSTFKGCAAASTRKIIRAPGQKLAKDYEELLPYIEDKTAKINEDITKGMKVLIEGSQGIDLDINHAEYPYTTSRQTHPTQLVADAGLPCQAVTNTIINLRTNPIRISNESAADGEHRHSGNYWDANEISWKDVAEQAGYTYGEFMKEYEFAMTTSVTNKIRRVFEFPMKRMKFVHALSGGLLENSNVLYCLNFVNFVDRKVYRIKEKEKLFTNKVRAWLNEKLYPVIGKEKLKWIRTGPKHNEMIEL